MRQKETGKNRKEMQIGQTFHNSASKTKRREDQLRLLVCRRKAIDTGSRPKVVKMAGCWTSDRKRGQPSTVLSWCPRAGVRSRR